MSQDREPASLALLENEQKHDFAVPTKRINEGADVSFWLSSKAYADIVKFLLQLNIAMFPLKTEDKIDTWTIASVAASFSQIVKDLQALIAVLVATIEEAPPDPGPRRFGNVSFRKWYATVEQKSEELLKQYLPHEVLVKSADGDSPSSVEELKSYLLGSFGSAQRLDFGTGHELSFLAFIGCIWKLGGFEESRDGSQERCIVLGVIEPYIDLIRKLIITYTLEPAGSHGVWGLDDHFFLPYIFGSAQLARPRNPSEPAPQEGSLPGAPQPRDITRKAEVDRNRQTNMYFGAIGFINDVKKGPFWEHSRILYDVSGVTAGWAKINKGMLKMYNAEVLSKFPVVQHFPFGSLFTWEHDPSAPAIVPTTHHDSLPKPRVGGHYPTPDPSVGMSAAVNTGRPAGTAHLPTIPQIPAGPTGLPMTRAPWATANATPQSLPGSLSQRPTGAIGQPRGSQRLPTSSKPAPTGPRIAETGDLRRKNE